MALESIYTEIMNALPEGYSQALAGGLTGVVAGFLGAVAILLFLAIYIYHAWAWMDIGKRMKYKYPWLAWIPFAGSAMRLQLGGFHWAWIFLVLIPIVGWMAIIILLTIAIWRVFDGQRYPGWLALAFPLMFFPLDGLDIAGIVYLVAIGLVAWKSKGKKRSNKKSRKKRKKK